MEIKFDANKKKLDTNPVFGLLVQGENLAESIQITGPKMVGALDLSQLRVAVRMTSQQYETTVEKTLEQATDGDTITFTWQVDKQFTGSPGKVDVMLVGYGGNDEVIKITSSGMVVQEDRTFDTAPPESTWEQILQQMQDFATQAYESKTAAANSAAEAAASQKVAEEKAEQATNAASEAVKAAETAAADAAAQAAAKTEQQIRQYTDDRYARPLVTKTGPAASLEVYPDKLSNLKVYANGFTQQAGTGDPSPTNVRALTNGGLGMYKLVIDGSHSITKETSVGGTVYYKVNVTCPANVDGASVAGYSKQYCNRAQIKNPDRQTQGDYAWVYGENLCRIAFFSKPWITTAEAMQADLATDPLIIWYIPADESQATGLYAPIILTGGEYRATCLPLTAPLCEGDSVVSWVKSGCDKVVTFDGSSDENWAVTESSNNVQYISVPLDYSISSGFKTVLAYCNRLAKVTPSSADANPTSLDTCSVFARFLGDLVIKINIGADSAEAAKQALAANPITIWLKSPNYTEAADIPVSLETHQQAVLVLDGTETITASTISAGKRFRIEAGNTPNVPVSSIDTGELKCTHYKPISRNSTNGGTQGISFWTPESNGFYVVDDRYIGDSDATNFKAYLAAQYAAGTPVTIVYQLATPITYAHPAVVLPALPDDDGKVTITGQSGGTVTVVFNKSIIQEIAEIKAAMLAMGANLSM